MGHYLSEMPDAYRDMIARVGGDGQGIQAGELPVAQHETVRLVGPPSAAVLERELLDARAALGIAVMIMSPEQMTEWGRQVRAMSREP